MTRLSILGALALYLDFLKLLLYLLRLLGRQRDWPVGKISVTVSKVCPIG